MSAPVLSAAAARCGVPDPALVADRFARLPVDQLDSCARSAAATAVALFQGSTAVQAAATATAHAWSTGRPAVTAIGQTAMAAMAGRAALDTLSGAIGGARATLAQLQLHSRVIVDEAETALFAAGFDPTTRRVAGAPTAHLPYPLSDPAGTIIDGTPGVVLVTVTTAQERLNALQAQLESALQALATALRTDPRDMVQRLPALPADTGLPATAPAAGDDLADLADRGFDLLTRASALGAGALGAAIGSALAGGAAGSGAATGGMLAAAVRGAASAVGEAVGSAVAAADAVLVPVPSTAAEADTEARIRLTTDLGSDDPATAARAAAIRTALDQAAASGQTVQLLTYHAATATSQGSAAIGIGDMGAADSVTTMVPGVRNSADGMSGALGEAARLQAEAHRRSPGESTAVVAWFGYDIPLTNGYTPDRVGNAVSATDDRAAVAGAAALGADLSRFRQYAPGTARQVVIGHSMGSVVVSAAAAQGAVIDDVVLLGSPGASRLADSVQDFPNVSPGHTWALALDDPITRPETDVLAGVFDLWRKGQLLREPSWSSKVELWNEMRTDPPGSQFGPDPAAAAFGANVVDAHSSRPELSTGQWESLWSALGAPRGVRTALARGANEAYDSANHPQDVYLSGTALTAIADITAGHSSSVRTRPGR